MTTCVYVLFFIGVAVKVNDIDFRKSSQQLLAHAAKGRVVQIPVRSNKGKDALSSFFHPPLAKADELHVIILEPLGIFFAKRLAVNLVIIFK